MAATGEHPSAFWPRLERVFASQIVEKTLFIVGGVAHYEIFELLRQRDLVRLVCIDLPDNRLR